MIGNIDDDDEDEVNVEDDSEEHTGEKGQKSNISVKIKSLNNK